MKDTIIEQIISILRRCNDLEKLRLIRRIARNYLS